MKTSQHLLLAFACAGAVSLQAQSTVNYTAGIGERDVVYPITTPVPDGNQVSIGFFQPGYDVVANGANLASLLSVWNEMGSTLTKPIFSQAGRFADNSYTTDPIFDNQKIWLWISKTTDNSAPNAEYSNLEAYGLFSSTSANWIFPAQDAPPLFSTASINSTEVDQAAFGSYDAGHLYLAPVPEPRPWVLGSLGLSFLFIFLLRGRPRRPACE